MRMLLVVIDMHKMLWRAIRRQPRLQVQGVGQRLQHLGMQNLPLQPHLGRWAHVHA